MSCNLMRHIRRHGSNIYLEMSPIQNDGLLSNVLVYVGKTSETVANWND